MMARWFVPPARRAPTTLASTRRGGAVSAPRSQFVADPGSDRRRNPQRRAVVDAMLAALDDPDEREAFLRQVRGMPVEPVMR